MFYEHRHFLKKTVKIIEFSIFLMPRGGHHEAMLALFGAMLSYVGAKLGHVRTWLDQLGPNFAQLGPNMA